VLSIEQERFGVTNEGTKVDRFLLRNGPTELGVITLGAIVQSLSVPDRDGGVADIVLGYDSLDGYLQDSAHGPPAGGRRLFVAPSPARPAVSLRAAAAEVSSRVGR